MSASFYVYYTAALALLQAALAFLQRSRASPGRSQGLMALLLPPGLLPFELVLRLPHCQGLAVLLHLGMLGLPLPELLVPLFRVFFLLPSSTASPSPTSSSPSTFH